MDIFFDHRVQAIYPGQIIEFQWHDHFGLLAAASFNQSTGATVTVFQEEGEAVQESVQRKAKLATVVTWHPVKKILATGWETGEITIRNEQENELYECPRLHRVEITIMRWSSNGSRLLTGDSVSGLLVVWKADPRGRLQQTPLSQQALNEQLTQVVLTPPPAIDPANDFASLARAAVSGDESALDMFAWQKGKVNPKLSAAAMGHQESITFFVGDKKGNVYFVNDNAKVSRQFTADGPIKKLLFYDEKYMLVTVTTNLMLTLHSVGSEGEAHELRRGKLSGKAENADTIWAGKGILATSTGEKVVRMWDLDKDENYVLNMEANGVIDPTDMITCIAFSPAKGVLAGGTATGKIGMWRYTPVVVNAGKKEECEDNWKLLTPSVVHGTISDLAFGTNKNLLAVNTIDNIYLLSEQQACCHCSNGTVIVQTGAMQLSVDIFSKPEAHHELKTDIQVKAVYSSKEALAILDGRSIVVYEIAEGNSMLRAVGSFKSSSASVCLYEQNVYTIEPGKIQVRNFQGTVKQLLPLPDPSDEVTSLEVCSQYLVIATAAGAVKLFDLSRREAKSHAGPKYLQSNIPNFARIMSAKCNSTGTKVSVIINRVDGTVDPRLYVWDIEIDAVQFFNFRTGRDEGDDYISNADDGDKDATVAERGKNEAAKEIAGRYPVSHFWDWEEPKLLICEAKYTPPPAVIDKNKIKISVPQRSPSPTKSLKKATMNETIDLMVVSLFVTPENGILVQDSFNSASQCNRLLALEIPYYYFAKKLDNRHFSVQQSILGTQSMVIRRIHRDFQGLEEADKPAKEAMMNFSFFLTLGDMDEAFKAIKVIKSGSVWENMAKMCVKTRRLDVAKVCLGNMGHARGAKMLREAEQNEPELDARVALLAIQLGLYEEAERLLKNCRRYDLLNEFYQSQAAWEKAMATAELYDRIHLRTTCYNYAKYLEGIGGRTELAIQMYERSGTHCFEVPRMLFEDQAALEDYITKAKDKALLKWWAQYMESNGEMEIATKFYDAAQDYLSLVRIYCFTQRIDKAAEVCNRTGDKAACYHLARQYENNNQFQEAIHFFTRAQTYGNAVRLCKEHEFDDKLLNMALLSKPDEMIDAARYYEFKAGQQDKAIMLYHKAGYFSKALELAFSSKQYSALQHVSESLDENTDPQLLKRCADFFIENSQFDRAVQLLAAARRYWDALKICMEQHVPMTEELVEKLSPPKEMEATDPAERNKILEGVGEVCMAQREYHLATKKFTQSGNRVKAMKALLKSGDTEKIVFFATVSRQKEIYVMAANYLQSLDWRKDPEIMKNIIHFYQKARSVEPLAGFFEACAELELDEFQNFEKAYGAMGEAYKLLSKLQSDTPLQETKLSEIKSKMAVLGRFIKIKSMNSQNTEEAMRECQSLLQDPLCEKAVRIGNVYGMMVENYARAEKWKMAYNCIEDMRSRMPRVVLSQYISLPVLEKIHRALNITFVNAVPQKNGYQSGPLNGKNEEEEDGEVLDEEVPGYD